MNPTDPKYALRQAAATGGTRCPLSGKSKYASEKQAKSAIKARAKRGRPLHWYRCPDPTCHSFHITKMQQHPERRMV